MSENTLNVKIIQRGDTEANWTSSNPILLKNEMAISTDKNGRYKIGDGTSKWSELSYSKADPTSHTHTKSQITDFPSSLKNPYALTLQGNGTTLTNGTYDGSAAKTVNITPDSIGASPKEGNTSLSKLASTITLGDGASGTILQNSATYQQKIEILDNSTSGDAVFNFSQSTDSGSNFTSLMQIRDDGNIVANKFTGTLTGNADTATKLSTARTINGTSFDGSANITTTNWGTARNVYIADSDATNTGAAVSVNGSGNATLKLPATIKATLSGNASTATTLATARNIKLTGDATGSASFNGSADASITTTLASSGVTAGSYGPSANASPAHKGTFSVPYFTVDAKGRVTAASTKTITLPADNNTTYSTGTSSTAGLTKLYTSTGTATDGTMTQNAINTALSGKSKVTIVRWS